MKIFFLTGTSGAGKSSLVKLLEEKFPVYDFDMNDVPHDANEKWRRDRTEYWLSHAAEGMLICGVTVPKEVRECPSYDNSFEVHFGYLHIDEMTIRSRLKEREWDSKEIDNQVVWAKHLEKYVLEDGGVVIDGEQSLEKVAEDVVKWVQL